MRKSFLLLLVVMLMFVFGGCGGGGSSRYDFISLDGVWEQTHGSGTAISTEGTYILGLRGFNNSGILRLISTDDDRTATFNVVTYSEWTATRTGGHTIHVIFDHSQPAPVIVNRINNDTFRYTIPGTLTAIEISFINNNMAEVRETGRFVVINEGQSVEYSYSVTYTFTRIR